MGESPEDTPDANAAIRPITVLSPHLITIPCADPSTQLVEKNAIFLDSRTTLSDGSLSRDWGSDSPVNKN